MRVWAEHTNTTRARTSGMTATSTLNGITRQAGQLIPGQICTLVSQGQPDHTLRISISTVPPKSSSTMRRSRTPADRSPLGRTWRALPTQTQLARATNPLRSRTRVPPSVPRSGRTATHSRRRRTRLLVPNRQTRKSQWLGRTPRAVSLGPPPFVHSLSAYSARATTQVIKEQRRRSG